MDEDNQVNQESLEKQKLDQLGNELENIGNKRTQEIPSQPNQPTQQPDTPQSVPPAMSADPEPQGLDKSKGILWIGIALLILALVGVGAYYFGSRKTTTSITPELVPTQTPTPTLNPMANWKIYTNSFHGYTIKYPEAWYLSEPSCEDECALTISDTSLILPANVPDPEDKTHLRLGILVFDQDTPSLQQWQETEVVKEESVEFSGMQAIKRTEIRDDFFQLSESVLVENVYINYKEKTYSLYYFPPSSDLRLTLDQILSTFEFIETTPSATITP
jgi:hypothetical protein